MGTPLPLHRRLCLLVLAALLAGLLPPAVPTAAAPVTPRVNHRPLAVLPEQPTIPRPAAASSAAIPASEAPQRAQVVDAEHAASFGINGTFNRPNGNLVQTITQTTRIASNFILSSPPSAAFPLTSNHTTRLFVDGKFIKSDNDGYGGVALNVFVRPQGTTGWDTLAQIAVVDMPDAGVIPFKDLTITLNAPYDAYITSAMPLGHPLEVVFVCVRGSRQLHTFCEFENIRLYEDVSGWSFASGPRNVLDFPNTLVTATVATEANGERYAQLHFAGSTGGGARFQSAPFILPTLNIGDRLAVSFRNKRSSSDPSKTLAGEAVNLTRSDNASFITLRGFPDRSVSLPWASYTSSAFTLDSVWAPRMSGQEVFLTISIDSRSVPPVTAGYDDIQLLLNGVPVPFGMPADQAAGKLPCDLGCSTQPLDQDPVNTYSGAFVQPATDMTVPSAGPELSFSRTYVSLMSGTGFPVTALGPGWRHRFAAALTLPAQTGGELQTIIYESPTGNRLRFRAPLPANKLVYRPVPGVHASLVAEDPNNDGAIDSYVLTSLSQHVQRFDPQGRIISESDAAGNQLTYTYFASVGLYTDGQLQSVTDQRSGQTLSFAYVQDGSATRLQRVSNVLGDGVAFGYNAGRLNSVTDLRGGVTEYRYQGTTALLTEVETPDDVVQVRNTYTNGRVTQQVEADGSQVTFAYTTTSFGPQTTITNLSPGAAPDVITYQYRPDATLRWVTQNGEFRQAMAWGERVSPAAVMDGNGQVTRVRANGRGQPTAITNARNETSAYAYDAQSRPTATTDSMGRRSTFSYDPANNNLLRVTTSITSTFLGFSTVYTYTAQNQLQEQRGPDGVLTRYDYTPQGWLSSVTVGQGTAAAQTTSYGYDALGRVVTTTIGVGSLAPRVDVTRYNPDGTVRELIAGYQDGIAQPNEVDADRITTFGYDLQGRQIWSRDALGQYQVTRYDSSGRAQWVTRNFVSFTPSAPLPAQPPAFTPAQPDANVTTFYGYDGLGRTTLITQTGLLDGTFNPTTRSFSAAAERVTRIAYDGASRPVTTTLNYRPGVAPGPDINVQTLTYYDGNGNPTWQRDALGRWSLSEYNAVGQRVRRIVNYENGDGGSVDPANLSWATITDSDWIETSTYRPDGQVSTVVSGVVDGSFDPAEPDRDRATRYIYDVLGRQQQVIQNLIDGNPQTGTADTDRISETAYDLVGRVQATRDPLGRWSSLQYDALSRVGTTISPCVTAAGEAAVRGCAPLTASAPDLNLPSSTRYDAQGRVRETENSLGVRTVTEYNGLGEVTRVVQNPLGVVPAPSEYNVFTAYQYDALGRVRSVENHTTERYSYDALGRRVTVTDGAQRTRRMGYDGTGTQRWMETPDGRFTVLLTDGLGRVVTTVVNYVDGSPAGDPVDVDLVSRTRYDAAGRRIAVVDAAERETWFRYDLQDRLVEVIENATSGSCVVAPCNVITRYTYDRVGNRLSIVDARGVTTHRFSYDAADQLVSQSDALGNTTVRVYDRGGRLLEERDPRGNAFWRTYQYDQQDRMVELSAPSLRVPIRQSYDVGGRRVSLSDATGVTAFAYDLIGRTTTITNPTGAVLGYTYTTHGQRDILYYPDGSRVSYRYGTDGQLSEVWRGSTLLAEYRYDPAGRLEQALRANGAETTYSYDGADRLNGLQTVVGGTTRSAFAYTLDRLGQRVGVSEQLDGSSRSIAYSYDGLLRLTGAVETPGTSYGYEYDLAGNRTRVTMNGNLTEVRNYNDANQVIGWSYDAAGNLLGDGLTTSSYDALGRMTSRTAGGQTSSFSSNGDGVLVSAQTAGLTTTQYLQDLASPLSQVLSDGSAIYLYGLDRLAAQAGGTTIWYASDALGSVRQTLDNAGTPLATTSYDPWGTPQGSTITPFGFTGELQDAVGLTYLRARWYTPGTGTFLAVDPFEGFPEQPYTQHPYNYALSNPVLYTDPTGRVYQDDRGERCPPWTSWDPFLKQCRPDWGTPPPNDQDVTNRPKPVQPRQSINSILDFCLGILSARRGPVPEIDLDIDEEVGKVVVAGIALQMLSGQINPSQSGGSSHRKHISLGLNDEYPFTGGPPLLFFFTLNLNNKLKSQNIKVYAYGDWPSAGLADGSRFFEDDFSQAVQRAEHIHFNLEGINGDPVVFADTNGPRGFIPQNFTAAELYRIRNDSTLCSKTSFYLNGSKDVSSPSAEMKTKICGTP